MNLIILTESFPFGKGEPFLETEVKYASEAFEKVIIISVANVMQLTRQVPSNFKVIKLGRPYCKYRCILYAFLKIFSRESIRELFDIRKMRCKPTLKKFIMSWFSFRMTEHRIDLYFKNDLSIDHNNTVVYSYWCDRLAYYLACHKDEWKEVVTRVHAFEIRDYEHYIPFRRKIDRTIDKMFFISEYTFREYNKILKPIIGKTRDNKYISRLGIEKRNIKKEKKLNTFIIISCSNVIKLKRIDLIINALSAMDEEYSVKWYHFGDGELFNSISEMAEEKLGHLKNIEYHLMGHVNNSDLIDFYEKNSPDLFINTSDIEGIPVSIMEALSYGIPVIARNVGGINEIVKDGINGFLLSTNAECMEVYDAIKRVVVSKKNNEVLFSEEHIVNSFINLYWAHHNYTEFYRLL